MPVILYFEKGHVDSTLREEWFQSVGINITHMQLHEDDELFVPDELPDFSSLSGADELIKVMFDKGWKPVRYFELNHVQQPAFHNGHKTPALSSRTRGIKKRGRKS
jgi:hypothetical protein